MTNCKKLTASKSLLIKGTGDMTASQQAKELGAKKLMDVAEFYQCTTRHLRDVHKRNEKGFIAMVRGYALSL